MPITALSTDTIRILGSAQVLTTPVSLVKELIDNGLDARATAIDVSISANTLDKIEVRDNGTGIDSSDFEMIGKRGHTSKLRAFKELRRLGGISLGFRGEALGSAVELAEVTVTTRTEGDPIAAVLKLKAPDGVYSQTKTSHPVGTTVCVQNFLSRLPVRKQTALKEAAKTLASAKELLKSYALARPHVKLSLKVLKSGKGNWSFAPRPHDGIKEVVSQVIGRELASQCGEVMHTSFRSLLDEDVPNSQETMVTNNDRDSVFEMHAFLPKPDADVTKISKGSYLSVDARAVSCQRPGTLKKIISIYREHLRAAISDTSSEKLRDPFICLNIVCPPGSYDPNVEPAKDDVLFENESTLLSLAHSMFETFYGNLAAERKAATKKHNGFDLLMARKPVTAVSHNEFGVGPSTNLPTAPAPISQTAQAPTAATEIPRVLKFVESPLNDISESLSITGVEQSTAGNVDDGKRIWGFSMGRDYEESEVQTPSRATSTFQTRPPDLDPEIEFPRASLTLNPWTIAKLNAPVQKRAAKVALDDVTLEMPARSANLPTPRQSSEPPSSSAVNLATPARTGHLPRAGDQTDLGGSYATWVERQEKRICRVPSTTEDQQSRSYSLPLEDRGDERRPQTTVTQHRNRARGDFVVARDLPAGDPWTPPPTQPASKRPRPSGFKPFQAPRRTGGFVAINNQGLTQRNEILFNQSNHTANSGNTPLSLPQSSEPQVSPVRENTPHHDLQYSLDFEKRKEDVNKKQRSSAPASRPSPHQNRYNAAIAVLDSISNTVAPAKTVNPEPFKTSLPDGDPRAYLMRRQKSLSVISNHPERALKLKRAKTGLLPLESIPQDCGVHSLVGRVHTDLSAVCGAVVELLGMDVYLRTGEIGGGLEMSGSDEEIMAIQERLMKACVDRGVIGEGQEVHFELSGLKK